jgi:glutamate-1-semialdehyde 2,1-aminomutase
VRSKGVFFHPHRNWFLSAAHTEKDIQETLDVTEVAFKAVKERFGT